MDKNINLKIVLLTLVIIAIFAGIGSYFITRSKVTSENSTDEELEEFFDGDGEIWIDDDGNPVGDLEESDEVEDEEVEDEEADREGEIIIDDEGEVINN